MKKIGGKFLHILLFIVIISIMGFMFGSYISSSWSKIREGARTLPRPQRHPITYDTQMSVLSADNANIPLNTRVNGLISQYFDVNGFVLPNTIATYVSEWTNQGNVDPKTKEKLNDIGYYLLVNVMPNIPTDTLPPPTVNWPRIQWTSDRWFPITDVANIWTNMINNNSSANYREFKINDFNFVSTATSESESESESTSETNQTCGNNGMSGSTCGNTCPQSCFVNAYMQNTAGSETSALTTTTTPGSNSGINGTGSNSKACQSVAQQNAGLSLNVTKNSMAIVTTNIPQTNTTLPSPLDTRLNEMIDQYFDPTNGHPTEYAIKSFNEIVQNAAPMDLLHKNKLRDIIYYFMQNIIPGLPTNSRPTSYVEWIPIRWLSHSSI